MVIITGVPIFRIFTVHSERPKLYVISAQSLLHIFFTVYLSHLVQPFG